MYRRQRLLTKSKSDPKRVRFSHWHWTYWKRCPKAFEYKMTIKPSGVRDDSRNAIGGFIVHALFEQWIKRQTNFSSSDWLYDNYDRVFDAECRHFYVIWRTPNDKEDLRKELKQWIKNTYELLHEHNLLEGKLYAEKKFVMDAGDDIQVVCKVDFVLKTPETIIVVDFKGVKRANVKYQDKGQLIIYDYAVGEYFDQKVEKTGYLWMNWRDVTWYHFTPADHQRVLKKWEGAVKDIRAEKFLAQPNQWNCRWCEYKSICPAFQKAFPGEKLFQNRTEGIEEGRVNL